MLARPLETDPQTRHQFTRPYEKKIYEDSTPNLVDPSFQIHPERDPKSPDPSWWSKRLPVPFPCSSFSTSCEQGDARTRIALPLPSYLSYGWPWLTFQSTVDVRSCFDWLGLRHRLLFLRSVLDLSLFNLCTINLINNFYRVNIKNISIKIEDFRIS